MGEFVRKIDGVTYLDGTRLWKAVSTKDVPVPERLREFMRLGGVRFFDEEDGGYNFVLQPIAVVTGFGGFPVQFDENTPEGCIELIGRAVTPQEIVTEFQNTMGRAGFYTYMNPGNHDPARMDEITTYHGHLSKAHAIQIDMSLMGYSAAIEGNLMLLRRWFNHVGRLTNTRTNAQSNPPLVVMDPCGLSVAQTIRSRVEKFVEIQEKPERGNLSPSSYRETLADHFEQVNALWPNSRALILMLNSGLNNLHGCMGMLSDPGQEREMHHMLARINDNLFPLFPKILKHSSTYGYEMPKHWPDYQQWGAQKGAYSAAAPGETPQP